jgi:D-glycero-alpha-D-manno-heptose 1-phosphate guanylyltransferase
MREAIILAGGKGTRLSSVVSDVPKPMAPVAGRPFLEYLLDRLILHRFDRLILSVGYMSNIIIEHFGDIYKNISISYVKEEKPLGTGGAIKNCMDKVDGDYALILNGDTYAEIDYSGMINYYLNKRNLVLCAIEVDNASRYGSLEIKDGFLVGFKEKGISNKGFINSGCYVIGKNQIDLLPTKHEFSFETDFLEQNTLQKKIAVIKAQCKFIDIGIPEDYLLSKMYLANING